MDSVPPPSDRLVEAALAEHEELRVLAARLAGARERTARQLASIDRDLADVAERQELLSRLAPVQKSVPERDKDEDPGQVTASAKRLQGPAIRKTAVRVLLGDPHAARAGIHYREWYERLSQAHYTVAGKDPVAVFLTQITRSPAVSKTDRPGVYAIDSEAPLKLRQHLSALHQALREMMTVTTTRSEDLNHVRSRRSQLTSEIEQTEKSLEEALELLEAPLAAADGVS